jgi:hypothetical protein
VSIFGDFLLSNESQFRKQICREELMRPAKRFRGPKASASCFLENLRVLEDGVSALVGFFLVSVGGGVIVAGLSFTRRSWTLCLWQCPLFPRRRTWSGARLCLLAPQANAALFIQLAPAKPSSLHRTRLGNHVARFSNRASCSKTGKARQPFAAFQSGGWVDVSNAAMLSAHKAGEGPLLVAGSSDQLLCQV